MSHRSWFLAAWAVAVLSGGFLAVTGVSVWRRNRAAEAETFKGVLNDARKEAIFLDSQLAAMHQEVHRLALDLAQGRLDPGSLPVSLPGVLERLPGKAQRIEVLFQTGAAREMQWVERQGRVAQYRRLEETGDPPLEPSTAAGWQEPETGPAGREHPLACLESFRLPGPSGQTGLVRLELDGEALQRDVSAVAPGADGYGFLLSRNGVYLVHPQEELVRSRRTLAQEGAALNDRGHARMAQAARDDREDWADTSAELNGQPSWIMVEPLPAAHWTLGMMIIKADVVPPRTGRGWTLTLIASLEAALLFLLSAAFLAMGPRRTRTGCLGWLSAVGSLLLLGSLVVCWRLAYRTPATAFGAETELMDPGSLDEFRHKFAILEAGREQAKATFIPTGLHILTIDLLGASQIKVSGIAWKRLPKGTPPGQIGAVCFPDALAAQFGEAWDQDEGSELVHSFPFQATFWLNRGSAASFPFDHADVKIRLWPWHKASSQVLVPDLDSYKNLLHSARPGLEQGLQVPGWRLESSHFCYDTANYETNFGVPYEPGLRNYPEMAFHFTLIRNWLNPFIFAFLPVFLVAGLLFALVMTSTRARDKASATGYSALNVIRSVISLFFPLAVAQFNLRSRVVTDGILYAEYYYFIMYGMILMVTFNALLLAKLDLPLLEREDNLLPKLLFWPVLMLGFHLVSLYYLPAT